MNGNGEVLDQYVTRSYVAKRWSISVDTLRRWEKNSVFCVRILKLNVTGGKSGKNQAVRYHLGDLKKFLEDGLINPPNN